VYALFTPRSCSSLQKLHPSALEFFDSLTTSARGKQVAVFLDYDGTLSPIVEDPERAFMSDQVRTAPLFRRFSVSMNRCEAGVHFEGNLGYLYVLALS
jgi:hypothetical protein